jgi:hypothetical protein
MSLAYYLPKWFFSYDVILELAFAVILLLVALLAFRVYRVTGHKPSRLLGVGFLFISLSNFVESALNFLMIAKTDSSNQIFTNLSLTLLNDLSVYFYMIFTTIGLAILLYMSFKIEKQIVLGLVIITSLLFIFLSKDQVYSFYLLAMIYLGVVSFSFIRTYLNNRKFDTLLITLAFIFLFIDRALFVFSFDRELSYVIGHFPELIAYLLILWDFYLIKRK